MDEQSMSERGLPLVTGLPERVTSKPPWLVDGPPARNRPDWPGGAKSPTWIKLQQECPLKHAEVYKRRMKEPPTKEMNVGTLVHASLEGAAKRRLHCVYKGIPLSASTEELLHLLEFEKEAQDPAVLGRAREIVHGMGPVSFRGVIHSEALLTYRLGNLLLAGYIDLGSVEGDPRSPEEVTITDYKTGEYIPDDQELFFDPQPGMYLSAARQRWPNAKRIVFKLWNVTHNEIRTLPWSRRLEENFLASARTAINAFNAGDETPRTGGHCERCHVRTRCKAFEQRIRESKRAIQDETTSGKTLEQILAEYREAQVLNKLAERRRQDLAVVIEGMIPTELKSYTAGRLQATRKRESYTAWDSESAALIELAQVTNVPLGQVIDDLSKGIGTGKLAGWIKGLPDEVRQAAEDVVRRRSRQSVGGHHIEVRELKARAVF